MTFYFKLSPKVIGKFKQALEKLDEISSDGYRNLQIYLKSLISRDKIERESLNEKIINNFQAKSGLNVYNFLIR